ncbi:phage tail protein [Pseudocitrobacter sp. 73]|uniref:phage tail fiber protein n=1 Tax=Pseudocitrobacter sp. 73 TaxID=2605731 RepID=UPI0011EDF92A|nr:phage tail protein [Pseudocitrobacter sp. 73]KAA1050548.1 phage tail protein [Pseudocitrobacter sp. 73]
MIYNTGTISINGNTATGTGTNWTAAASQIRVSQTIIVLSNPVQMFQITAINSGTSLTVTPAASPALSGQKYGILVTDSLSVDGLAQSMSQLINEYDENIGAWETFASTSANQSVTVTINGVSVTIPALGKLAQKGSNGAVPIAQGGHGGTTAADARTNLGLGSSATKDVGDSGDNVVMANNLHAAFMKATPMLVSNQASDFGSNFNLLPIGDSAIGLNASNGMASGPGITGQHWAILSQYGWGHKFLIDWIYSGSAVHLGTRFYNASGEVTGWTIFYNNRNTTKASDGTLKAASPIVQVYTDGSCHLNDESEGCTVTRLSVGEYLIEGCTGLNADAAWGGIDGGFDIPTDRNKQPLIWLDYEVNADGSVLVKTYHRTNPGAPEFARNEIDGLADGDPVDIPTDQFVSVRVQMPACSIWNQKQEEAIDAMRKFESEEPTDSQQG